MTQSHLAEARALQALTDYRNAVVAGSGSGLDPDDALDRFETALDFVDSDTRARLEDLIGTVEIAVADRAFQDFAALVDRFRSLDEAFELGARLAAAGQNDLFFPAAAAHLAQFAGLLKELKAAADTVKEGIDGVEAAFEKRDVEALIEEAGNIKTTIDDLLDDFKEIKAQLP